MIDVFICDGVRTPIGRYGGGLSSIRTDDLAAIPISALMARNAGVEPSIIDDVMLGCANQAGEDNRNVARMATLLAGLPCEVPASTLNRLCGSGLNAVGISANVIRSGEADLIIAGGVESMSRAPYVMGKANDAFSRNQEIFDTTMGWRFINPRLDFQYGTESMPKTAENLASQFGITRQDQDRFALWSQTKASDAMKQGYFSEEIIPVSVTQRKGADATFDTDEHLRATTLEKLGQLKPIFDHGTVTAGNASGINDGAAAMLLASEQGARRHNLEPKAKIVGMAVTGVLPSVMGIGAASAASKLLTRLNLSLDDIDLLELNEAFAVQVLSCTRALGLSDNDSRINPQGGAIALGHPLGMSGGRLAITAMRQLQRTNCKRALCAMCVGVGQGVALVLERV